MTTKVPSNLPLKGHKFVTYQRTNVRNAFGDDDEACNATHYKCSCGVEFGSRGIINPNPMNGFVIHCLEELGAK